MTASLAEKVLGDPAQYPSALTSWIQSLISGNPNITFTESQLPDPERLRLVGGTAQPVFLDSWVNYGSGARTACFYKDPLGRVFLSGLVGGGGSGTIIWALPTGYRPEMKEQFVVITDTGVGRVDVDEDGNVTHVSGGTTYVSLAGIGFRAL